MLISDAFAADAAKGDAAEGTIATVVQDGEAVPYELSLQKQLMDTVMFIGLLFVIFYFIMLRPQQKRYRSHMDMLKSIQRGSRVITGGGIIGHVVKLEGEDIVVVEIAQGIKVRVARDTISQVLEGTGASETANDN